MLKNRAGEEAHNPAQAAQFGLVSWFDDIVSGPLWWLLHP